VGDAGYNLDFITGQGITDAFRDAKLCAEAIDASLSGREQFGQAMDEYQGARDDRVRAMYEFTCQLATLEPPPPELQRLLGAIQGSQQGMDWFARINAGTTSPAELFEPEASASFAG
jgi:2-polyprenyl-6-methoxyphenol hydroxylase-like FAD-dependent oxidoreductase